MGVNTSKSHPETKGTYNFAVTVVHTRKPVDVRFLQNINHLGRTIQGTKRPSITTLWVAEFDREHAVDGSLEVELVAKRKCQ